MKQAIVLIVLTINLSACSQLGTGTGNPLDPVSNGSQPMIASVFAATCEKISSCHAPDADTIDCGQSISALTTFAEKLGIHQQPPPQVREIIEAQIRNELVPNPNAQLECVRQIDALSCHDPLVANSFDKNATQPYAKAADVMPADCTKVFGP